MELKVSSGGIPYIELDDNNKIIFSDSTSTKEGYKWLTFSGIRTTTTSLSAGKGKKKTRIAVKSRENISFMMDMAFSGVPSAARTANIYLTKKYLAGVKRVVSPYVEDGILPFTNIPKLSDALNKDDEIDPEDRLEEDPYGYYEDDEDEE